MLHRGSKCSLEFTRVVSGFLCNSLLTTEASILGPWRNSHALFRNVGERSRIQGGQHATCRATFSTEAISETVDPQRNKNINNDSEESLEELRVWSWGRGDSGQLGHGLEDPEWEPRCIESFRIPVSILPA